MNTQEYLDLENQYGAHNYKPLDVVLTKGEGVWVWDVDGKKYLDCLAAYSAVNQGHCHPAIMKTMMAQASNLTAYITDSRDLVYKHTVKAQGIEDTPFIHREESRFGMIYDLKGDVASAVQFFVTDSTTHFLRGSLYFNCRPNRDSLNPVIEFLREDIIHMIETTSWKY